MGDVPGTVPAMDVASLPGVAREIAELVGLPTTLRLVEAWGGTTFPVPKRETNLGELRFGLLEQVVGVKAADILCRHYGGTRLYIPRCADALRRARDAAITRHFDETIAQGRTAADVVAELALRYRVSDRMIWRILKGGDYGEEEPLRRPSVTQGWLL